MTEILNYVLETQKYFSNKETIAITNEGQAGNILRDQREYRKRSLYPTKIK